MPNLDKTGPQGQGKETGRGLGDCDDTQTQATGKGLGPCGQGLARGRRADGQGRGMGRQVNLDQLGKEASGEKNEEK